MGLTNTNLHAVRFVYFSSGGPLVKRSRKVMTNLWILHPFKGNNLCTTKHNMTKIDVHCRVKMIHTFEAS